MIESTTLQDVLRITPPRFGDHRGFFSESWNKKRLADAGFSLPEFVQD
ncbi:MAG: dTDP-4-dehydrorhamnose 3,5-epimerase family protein, partial [Alphaproteobacteria bacterium]|nr:dTDP-4-dehydrorhamnose 3,5-epimerase family protein [Alphaproteobacteria bacterium]